MENKFNKNINSNNRFLIPDILNEVNMPIIKEKKRYYYVWYVTPERESSISEFLTEAEAHDFIAKILNKNSKTIFGLVKPKPTFFVVDESF